MFPVGEDGGSWEDNELASIAKNRYLLDLFQTVKYIDIALLTILLYDHCLTFELERRRIWTLSWKLPKCLFLFNRYILPPLFIFEVFSNLMQVGHRICDVRIYTLIPLSAAVLIVELMFILRVLALYGNSPRLARYLVIQLFVHWVIGGSIFASFVLPSTKSIIGYDIFTGCLYEAPSWTALTWMPFLVIESILVILALYKCRKYGQLTPTVMILARDSVLYFITIFSQSTSNQKVVNLVRYRHVQHLLCVSVQFN